MDKLDIRIIREFIQGNPLLSIWPVRDAYKPKLKLLSRKLGASESTIRARVRGLSGLISEGTFVLNPVLHGEKMGALVFDVSEDESKKKVLEELKLVEDMFIIIDYTGRSATAVFFYSDENSLRKKINFITLVSGCEHRKIFTQMLFPGCKMRLRSTDLRILEGRMTDMKKSKTQLARELGISSRTVERRLTRMALGGAIMPFISFNASLLEDCVYCDILVTFREQGEARTAAEEKILPLLDDNLTFYGHFETFTEFNMLVPSIPIGEKLRGLVERMANVKLARVEFVENRIELYGIELEKVKEQLALAKRIEKARHKAPLLQVPEYSTN